MVPEDKKPTPTKKNELDLQSPDVQTAWARIAARASVDEPFLERLRASPAEVFAEFGVTLDRKVDLNEDFSPSLDEILASAQAASAPPVAPDNALQVSAALVASAASFTGNPFCGCMCKGTTMTAASGNVVAPVSGVSAGAGLDNTSQAIPPCVGTHATQPCSQMCSCMCYPCVAATPFSPAEALTSELAVNRVGSGSMQTNATVSGCFCGQYCSTTSTMMSTPLETGNRLAGSQGGGMTGMQNAIPGGRSAGTMATAFCMNCQACACYGTNGGCWGSFPVCAATLGVGAQTMAASSTMSSTPLSGGGTLGSYGCYSTTAGQPGSSFGCQGTQGTLSGCTGTVSSIGCY